MQAPLMFLPRPILIAIFEFGCYIESHIVFEMCLVVHMVIINGMRLSEKCARYAIDVAHRRHS